MTKNQNIKQQAMSEGRTSESSSQLNPASHPSPITHYPSPAVNIVGGEVSEALFEKGLCLPSGTAMEEGDLERVVGVIRAVSRLTAKDSNE